MAFGLPKTHNVSTTPLNQETNTRQGNGNNKQTKREKKNVDGRTDTSKLEKLDMSTAKRKQRNQQLINIKNRKRLSEAKRQQLAKRGVQRNVMHVKAKRPVGRPTQGLTENHAKPQYMTRVPAVSLFRSLSANGIWIGVNSNMRSCSFVGEGGLHMVFTNPCGEPKKCLCQKR